MTPDQKDIEILLIQDSKNRWTIPKGHIEQGETAKQTAIRDIGEEAGDFAESLHHGPELAEGKKVYVGAFPLEYGQESGTVDVSDRRKTILEHHYKSHLVCEKQSFADFLRV